VFPRRWGRIAVCGHQLEDPSKPATYIHLWRAVRALPREVRNAHEMTLPQRRKLAKGVTDKRIANAILKARTHWWQCEPAASRYEPYRVKVDAAKEQRREWREEQRSRFHAGNPPISFEAFVADRWAEESPEAVEAHAAKLATKKDERNAKRREKTAIARAERQARIAERRAKYWASPEYAANVDRIRGIIRGASAKTKIKRGSGSVQGARRARERARKR